MLLLWNDCEPLFAEDAFEFSSSRNRLLFIAAILLTTTIGSKNLCYAYIFYPRNNTKSRVELTVKCAFELIEQHGLCSFYLSQKYSPEFRHVQDVSEINDT